MKEVNSYLQPLWAKIKNVSRIRERGEKSKHVKSATQSLSDTAESNEVGSEKVKEIESSEKEEGERVVKGEKADTEKEMKAAKRKN